MFLPRPTGELFWSSTLTWSKDRNPSLRDFGFNDNAIRNQEVFRPIAGNVRGGQDQSNSEFSCEPIPCQKKAKKD